MTNSGDPARGYRVSLVGAVQMVFFFGEKMRERSLGCYERENSEYSEGICKGKRVK